MTAERRPPPMVLTWREVEITRPPAEPVEVRWPPRAAVDVPWPRTRVTGGEPSRPPGEIRLAAPPRGPWRLPLPPVVCYMLSAPAPR